MPHTPVGMTVSRQSPKRNYTTPRKLQFGGGGGGGNVAEENSRNGAKQTKSSTCQQNANSRTNLPSAPVQQLNSSLQSAQSSDSGSDCSVAKLKGWLDDFGKQNKNHSETVNKTGQAPTGVSLQKPIRAKVNFSSSIAKQQQVKRSTETMRELRKGATMTPVRFKARPNSKVEATDSGYASVKQLSAWLADDPTTLKNDRGCVRRGINVINKSRKFEKNLEDVIIEEVDKKKWLQNANSFGGDNESDFDQQSAVTELVSVQDKKKWLTGAFGDGRRMCSSVIEGGSRTVVSVNDKRDWLSSAFQKGSDRMVGAKDTATPAKEKWRRRRSSRQLSASKASPIASVSASDASTVEVARAPNAAQDVAKAVPSSERKSPSAIKAATPVQGCVAPLPAKATVPVRVNDAALNMAPIKAAVSFQARTSASAPAKAKSLAPVKAAASVPLSAAAPVLMGAPAPISVSVVASVQASSVDPAQVTTTAANPAAAIAPVSAPGIAPVQMRAAVPNKSIPVSAAQYKSRNRNPAQSIATVPPRGARPVAAKPTPFPRCAPTRHEVSNDQNCQSQPSAASESQVDFKAARLLLVQRSKANGNPVKVLTKVQMRKTRFEKWEKNLAKGSGPKGLLKPTWGQEDGRRRSSTHYAKTFVEDFAPKKSFGELP